LQAEKNLTRPDPPQVGGLNELAHLFKKIYFFSILKKLNFNFN